MSILGEERKEGVFSVAFLLVPWYDTTQNYEIYGAVGNTQVLLLIDSGASHNFIAQKLVTQLGF